MITDPLFYIAAVPAVLIYGVSKGGFGGALGFAAVPLMSLVVSPLRAAAILLPILCLMDIATLWEYRGRWVWPELRVILPASLIGIAAGTLLFDRLEPHVVRLVLGIIAIVFTLHYAWHLYRYRGGQPAPFGPVAGTVAATAAGFTSFVAHAGGPPINMYLLRRGLDRTAFVATTAMFFAVVNYVKLVPYTWLGQFDSRNLLTALVLAPLAPVGVKLGAHLHRRVQDRVFFLLIYGFLFLVGCRLVWIGAVSLLGAP